MDYGTIRSSARGLIVVACLGLVACSLLNPPDDDDAAAALAALGAAAGAAGSGSGAPTNLVATAGNGQLSLAWDAVAGASGYVVAFGSTASLGTTATGITAASHVLTGLTNFQTYYAVVRAVSSSGTSGDSNVATGRPVKDLLIFGTTSTFGGGNLGGCTAANTSCNNDAGKPNTSTYRAMLDGCTSALTATASYYRSNGTTLIATTNSSGALPATLTNSIMAAAGAEFVTGHGGQNCSTYTNGTSGTLGVGEGNSTTTWWVTGVLNETCNIGVFQANRLYCVEQP